MGDVVDFETGSPDGGTATMIVSGLNAQTTISVMGSAFSITGIPLFSVFFLYTGAPPTHRQTYNVATTVADRNLTGVQAMVASEAYLTELQTAFAVTPAAGTGIVIARLVDAAGAPREGLGAGFLRVNGAAQTAYYLDADKQAAAVGTVTSTSGYVVFYDVAGPEVAITADMGASYTVTAPVSPVAANSVTLVDVTVEDGAQELPVNVSFAGDILPIFQRRGCQPCHSGNGIGRDLGDLTLDGAQQKIYQELTEEISPKGMTVRVNLAVPEMSLLLLLPGLPVDRHPNVTFASYDDPDYLLILVWIREGALMN
jgi:hypothetical protein